LKRERLKNVNYKGQCRAAYVFEGPGARVKAGADADTDTEETGDALFEIRVFSPN
jgi:hypothetical protein